LTSEEIKDSGLNPHTTKVSLSSNTWQNWIWVKSRD